MAEGVGGGELLVDEAVLEIDVAVVVGVFLPADPENPLLGTAMNLFITPARTSP